MKLDRLGSNRWPQRIILTPEVSAPHLPRLGRRVWQVLLGLCTRKCSATPQARPRSGGGDTCRPNGLSPTTSAGQAEAQSRVNGRTCGVNGPSPLIRTGNCCSPLPAGNRRWAGPTHPRLPGQLGAGPLHTAVPASGPCLVLSPEGRPAPLGGGLQQRSPDSTRVRGHSGRTGMWPVQQL